MRTGAALVCIAVTMLTLAANAAPSVSLTSGSALQLSLLAGASAPIVLAVNPGSGATASSVGANATSASTTVTGNTILVQTFNTTWFNNSLTTRALQARLVQLQTSGAIASCANCTLRLRCGSTTTDEIIWSGGVARQTTGNWVTLDAKGGACAQWSLYVLVKATNALTSLATITYTVEIQGVGTTSPRATYTTMTAKFYV